MQYYSQRGYAGVNFVPEHVSASLEIVLAGTTGAGRMVPPNSTRIPARMKCVQIHISPMNMHRRIVHVRFVEPMACHAMYQRCGEVPYRRLFIDTKNWY